MKNLLLLLALGAPAAPLRAQSSAPAWTDHRRALPDKLRQVAFQPRKAWAALPARRNALRADGVLLGT